MPEVNHDCRNCGEYSDRLYRADDGRWVCAKCEWTINYSILIQREAEEN